MPQVGTDSMSFTKGACFLLPNQITLEIAASSPQGYKWTSKHHILTSLSRLLNIDLSNIDLISAEYLPFFRLAFRILIKFTSSRIPKLCHERKHVLGLKKIWIRRVFQTTDVKPLFRRSARRIVKPPIEPHSLPSVEPSSASVPLPQPSTLNSKAQEAQKATAGYPSDLFNSDSVTASLESCIANLKIFFTQADHCNTNTQPSDSAASTCSWVPGKKAKVNQASSTALLDSTPSLTSGEEPTSSFDHRATNYSDPVTIEAQPCAATPSDPDTCGPRHDPEHLMETTVASNPPTIALSPVCRINRGPQGGSFTLVDAQAQSEPPLNFDFTTSNFRPGAIFLNDPHFDSITDILFPDNSKSTSIVLGPGSPSKSPSYPLTATQCTFTPPSSNSPSKNALPDSDLNPSSSLQLPSDTGNVPCDSGESSDSSR